MSRSSAQRGPIRRCGAQSHGYRLQMTHTGNDPIADSAALHLKRALALLTAGQIVFARLYLVLLALAFQKAADIDLRDEQDRQALKRAAANILATAAFVKALHDTELLGAGGLALDAAIDAVSALPLEEHENERLGSIVANIWRCVENPYWPGNDAAIGGFSVRVEARLKNESYVDATLSFPDAARSHFSASKLCPTHEEGKAYAGKIAALFDALIAIEVKANDLAPPAPREALQTAPEAS